MIAILYVARCFKSTSKKQFSENSSNNHFLGKCDHVNKDCLYRCLVSCLPAPFLFYFFILLKETIVFLMGMEQQLF